MTADGGGMAAGIEKAIKKQPTAVGFGGEGVMPGRGLGWTGTESGHPDCAESIWSTGGSPCGAANSTLWAPETSDTTLQLNDHWFWTPPATMIRSLKEMISVYHDTVGSNAVMELDFAIDRDGETDRDGRRPILLPVFGGLRGISLLLLLLDSQGSSLRRTLRGTASSAPGSRAATAHHSHRFPATPRRSPSAVSTPSRC